MNKIIYIEPYVYANRTENDFLFYNTLDGEKIVIKNSSKIIKDFMNILFEKSNNFVAIINDYFFNNIEIKRFVFEIRDKFIGDIIHSNGDFKPVQFSPIINIQEAKTFNGWNIEKNIFSYVNTIEIATNNCSKKALPLPALINDFLRNPTNQFIDLKLEHLKKIIILSRYHPYWDINIGGSNLFKYKDLIKLLNNLKDLENRINVLIPFSIDSYNFFSEIQVKYNFNKIEYFFTLEILITNIKFISEKDLYINIFIDNTESTKEIIHLLSKYGIYNYKLYPSNKYLQNKSNLYFTEEELFQSKQSMEEILLKGEMNRFLYGKLIIMEDTKVFSNVFKEELGKLNESSFEDILRVEIEKKRNWFETRKNVEPCKKCLFKLICPSLSLFEWQIKHFNNCFMSGNK